MELENEFVVNRAIDQAWAILTDLERIAPCLPGAQLQEIEGDVYRGVVKVKVGPIGAALKGEASFVEKDDPNHRAVLKGEGRDTKGNGNASALITATLKQLSPTSVTCVVHTNLNMTGKVAQFGRGALADISGKLMQQFARNLDEMLARDGATPTGTSASTTTVRPATLERSPATEEPSPAPNGDNPAATAAAASTAPTKRAIRPATAPIKAFSLGGTAIVKRLLPVIGASVVLLLVLSRRKGSSRPSLS